MEYEKQSLEPFKRYIIDQVFDLFVDSRPLKRSQILKIPDPDILYLAEPIIDRLVKNGFLSQEKCGAGKLLAKPQNVPEMNDDIIKDFFSVLPIF